MKLLIYQLDEKYKSFLKILKYFVNEYANANNLTALNIEKIHLIEEMIKKRDIKSIFILPKNVFPNFFSNIIKSQVYNKTCKIRFKQHNFINININNTNNNLAIFTENFQKSIPTIDNNNNYYIEPISTLNRVKLKRDRLFFIIDELPNKNFIHTFKSAYFNWPTLNMLKLKYIFKNRLTSFLKYDGKNKHISKEIIQKLNVSTPKTYQILTNIKDIDYESLPNKYIIKPSNLDNSRLVYIVKNGYDILKDIKISKELFLQKFHNFNNVLSNKELNPLIKKKYKPSIIIEEYIENKNNSVYPVELKIYVFNGEIKFIIVFDKNKHWRNFDIVDSNWEKIPFDNILSKDIGMDLKLERPKYFTSLKDDVYKIFNYMKEDTNNTWLSKFIRIDFFITENNYYFGEFALFPNGGKGLNINNQAKRKFAEYWFDDLNKLFINYAN